MHNRFVYGALLLALVLASGPGRAQDERGFGLDLSGDSTPPAPLEQGGGAASGLRLPGSGLEHRSQLGVAAALRVRGPGHARARRGRGVQAVDWLVAVGGVPPRPGGAGGGPGRGAQAARGGLSLRGALPGGLVREERGANARRGSAHHGPTGAGGRWLDAAAVDV